MAIIHCYKQHRQKNENSFCSYTVSGIRQKVIYYICTKNYSWPTEFGHSGKWKVVESRNDFLPSPLESFVPIVSKGFRNDWQFRICQLGKCLVDSRGRPFDFWGGYGWFQKKIYPADWFREEKSMQRNSWKNNILHWKKHYTVECGGKKNSNSRAGGPPAPEVSEKKLLPQLITHTPSPTKVQSSCQPFTGWGRNGFDTLVNVMHQQNGLRAFNKWWFSRLKFCISRLYIHG